MKKAVTLLIAVLYFTLSSGLAVEIHHCMGGIADVSLATHSEEQSTCHSCGMPKSPNNCCKDELKFVKILDAYKLLTVNYQIEVPQIALRDHHHGHNYFPPTQVLFVNTASYSQRCRSNTSIYKLNSVFRI